MRKCLISIVLLLLSFNVAFGEGPFGLEKGMKLEEVAVLLGEEPQPYVSIVYELQPYLYSVSTLPKTLPEFDQFVLRITPIAGLSEIYIYTKELGPQDANPRAQYGKFVKMISEKYPIVLDSDRSSSQVIFDHIATWRSSKDGIESITLRWKDFANMGNVMSFHYRFDNWDIAKRDAEQAEKKKENVF